MRFAAFATPIALAFMITSGAVAQQPVDLALSAKERAGETLANWRGDLSQGAKLDFSEARDLSQGGVVDAFSLSLDKRPGDVSPSLIVWSGEEDASIWEWTPYTLPNGRDFLIPFTDFVPLEGWGADFTRITRVAFQPGVTVGGALRDMAVLLKGGATLSAENVVTVLQQNSDGLANPGERLRYSITITNSGSSNATNVFLTDLPDAKTQLVDGLVQTTSGTVTSGNGAGDSAVAVSIPLIGVAPCQPQVVLVRYEVVIDNPFSDLGGEVCDQASLTSPDAPFAVSNDPNTAAPNDPTCITVVLGPEAMHAADQNGDGRIDFGELLRVVQLYNSNRFGCQAGTEDGYLPGGINEISCLPHDSDFMNHDWSIELGELLRAVQFFNLQNYFYCPGAVPASEDTFCAAV